MSRDHEELAEVMQVVHNWLAENARKISRLDELPAVRLLVGRQIVNQPGITVSEMSRRLGIAKSHISNIVEEFSQLGWVEKKADPQDKRILHIFLSEAGFARVERNRTVSRRAIADVIADLPSEQAIRMGADLKVLLTTFQRTLEKGS